MSKTHKKLASILSNSLALNAAAGTKLEKLASYDAGLEKFAAGAATKLAKAGLIAEADISEMADEIKAGGFDKVSEAFDYVIQNVGTGSQLGKAASVSAEPQEETADERWERAWGVRS